MLIIKLQNPWTKGVWKSDILIFSDNWKLGSKMIPPSLFTGRIQRYTTWPKVVRQRCSSIFVSTVCVCHVETVKSQCPRAQSSSMKKWFPVCSWRSWLACPEHWPQPLGWGGGNPYWLLTDWTDSSLWPGKHTSAFKKLGFVWKKEASVADNWCWLSCCVYRQERANKHLFMGTQQETSLQWTKHKSLFSNPYLCSPDPPPNTHTHTHTSAPVSNTALLTFRIMSD